MNTNTCKALASNDLMTLDNPISISSYQRSSKRDYKGAAIIDNSGQEIAITDAMINNALNRMIKMSENIVN